ncbi:hypothetical protein MIR68_012109 [Amoeboaphelidium protococcarum]|nr:hypothetical protein MIR68_012109 [Amoeboaphelidium protococcarum]
MVTCLLHLRFVSSFEDGQYVAAIDDSTGDLYMAFACGSSSAGVTWASSTSNYDFDYDLNGRILTSQQQSFLTSNQNCIILLKLSRVGSTYSVQSSVTIQGDLYIWPNDNYAFRIDATTMSCVNSFCGQIYSKSYMTPFTLFLYNYGSGFSPRMCFLDRSSITISLSYKQTTLQSTVLGQSAITFDDLFFVYNGGLGYFLAGAELMNPNLGVQNSAIAYVPYDGQNVYISYLNGLQYTRFMVTPLGGDYVAVYAYTIGGGWIVFVYDKYGQTKAFIPYTQRHGNTYPYFSKYSVFADALVMYGRDDANGNVFFQVLKTQVTPAVTTITSITKTSTTKSATSSSMSTTAKSSSTSTAGQSTSSKVTSIITTSTSRSVTSSSISTTTKSSSTLKASSSISTSPASSSVVNTVQSLSSSPKVSTSTSAHVSVTQSSGFANSTVVTLSAVSSEQISEMTTLQGSSELYTQVASSTGISSSLELSTASSETIIVCSMSMYSTVIPTNNPAQSSIRVSSTYRSDLQSVAFSVSTSIHVFTIGNGETKSSNQGINGVSSSDSATSGETLLRRRIILFWLQSALKTQAISPYITDIVKEYPNDKPFGSTVHELSIPAFLEMQFNRDIRPDKILTEGGIGIIYLATRLNSEMTKRSGIKESMVVAKVLKQELAAQSERIVQSVYQEISLMYLFRDHPNFARLYNYSSDPVAIVMKFYPLGALRNFIHGREQTSKSYVYSKRAVVHLLNKYAAALMYMHKKRIAHCDIKPDNVLLQDNNGQLEPEVTDLGISNVLDSPSLLVNASAMTNLRGISITYSAPEAVRASRLQTTNPHAVILAGDVYSLSIVVMECLMRKKPWS